MSDFLQRLCNLLSIQKEEWSDGLSTWNDDIEIYLQKSQKEETSCAQLINENLCTHHDRVNVKEASFSLRVLFMRVLAGQSLHESVQNLTIDPPITIPCTYDTVLDSALKDWKNDKITASAKIEWFDMCVVVRTMKNWWRWYLQIYLPLLQDAKRQHSCTELDVAARQLVEDPWRVSSMLELFVLLIEELAVFSSRRLELDDGILAEGSIYFSNLFFYVTYPLSASDATLTDAYTYMISKCNIMGRFLYLMIRPDVGMSLHLTLVRNVHNGLVSFPELATKAVNGSVAEDPSSSLNIAEWILGGETVTYKIVLRDLLLYVLTFNSSNTKEVSMFPGTFDDNVDRQTELIMEILRCCFALRIGSDMTLNQRWQSIIEAILQSDSSDVRYYDCQCAAVPIVMDASSKFRDQLSTDSINKLLDILDKQVSMVLKENYIDDRAAAALNPILAVIYKLCGENANGCAATIRKKVFPGENQIPERPESLKNMSPMDAPQSTLRWKLIQLLTWPNGFVKRLAGELLFLLCDKNQKDFVHCVGMGNAVTLLSVKGLIDLPSSVHS
jgi:Guanine nucleotide exchange factor synembryn